MSRTRLIATVIIISIAFVALGTTAAWAAAFTGPTNKAASNPQAVAFADFDGDGNMDMAVVEDDSGAGNGNPAHVVVYLGDGAGGFDGGHSVTLPTPAPASKNSHPTSIAAAIFKTAGGSKPDFVVGDPGSIGSVYYCANNGAGIAFTCTTVNSSFTPTWIGVGHFTSTTLIDIAISEGKNIQVFPGVGDGTFGAPVATTQANNVTDFAVVDLNADGFDDIVAITSGVSKWINKADASSTFTVTTVAGTSASPVAVATGTLGGKPSAFVVSNVATTNNATVLIGDGAGGLTATILSVTGTPVWGAIADIDQDGKGDLVYGTTTPNIRLLQGTNAGGTTFAAFNFSPLTTGAGLNYVASLDLNKDGSPDIVTSNSTANNAEVYINNYFAAITPLTVTNPKEGAAFGPTDLFTFKYPGSPAVGSFTVSITNWGDGASDTGSVTGPVAGVYTATGPSHTYTEQGPETVSVTLANTTATTTAPVTHTITVDDAPLTAQPTPDISSAGAGVPFVFPVTTLIANFSDANSGAPTSDFSVSIDWGDGSAVVNCPSPCASVSGSGGTYQVKAGHTYNVTGNFPIATTITDTEGGGTETATVNIHANVSSVNVSAAAAIASTEGTSTGSKTVATFTSSRAGAASTEFAATINWGDGTGDIACAAPCAKVTGAGPFTIADSHTYAEAGPFSIKVTVTDSVNSDTGSANTPATIADAALSVVAVPGLPGTEGVSTGAILVGKFNDANLSAPIADFTTVNIHWGDGNTTAGTVTQPGGAGTTFSITGTHTYAAAGVFNITLDVFDVDSPNPGDPGRITAGAGAVMTIADAALTAGPAGPAVSGVEGVNVTGSPVTIATFTDGNPVAPIADFTTANIHWGDGNTSVGTITQPGGAGTSFTLKGTHAYTEAGVYNITYDVFDTESPNPGDPGRITAGTGPTATITDAPLTAAATPGLNQVEGNVTFTNAVVGKFNDGNVSAPIADFTTVNIHWGDGNTTAGTITQPGGIGSTFFVTGTHTYASAEEATYNVTFDVFDTDSPNPGDPGRITGGTGAVITITDALLTPAVVPGLSNPEGNGTFTNVTVGSFTDAYAAAPITDFTATIHWADATTSAGTITQPGGVGTAFIITGTHVYAATEESNVYNITIDVADVGGSTISGAAGAQVKFTDAPLTVGAAPAPLATTEGLALSNVPVGTFTDGFALAPLTDFPTATIHWGDGVSTAGTVTQPGGVGTPFVVNGTHTYAEKGVFNVTFDVADIGGSNLAGAAGTTATIADAAIVAGAPPAGLNGTEGNAVAGPVGSFTDANPIAPLADFPPANVTIHWGDGNSTAGTVTQPGGAGTAFSVTGNHIYAEPGVYNITFDVFDIDSPNPGDPGRITGGVGNTATITDAALTVVATAGVPAVEGNPVVPAVATFHDANPSAPVVDFTTVNIHWGDGVTTAGVVTSLGGGNFSVSGTHTYAEKGVFNVTFDVFDVDSPNPGDPGRITAGAGATVTVADAALGIGAAVNGGGGEGVPLNGGAPFVVANFFDCNPAAPLADFNVPTIHWGDGASSAGTIAATVVGPNPSCPGGTAANFTISAPNGTHTYTSNAVFNITIDVADVDGSSIAGGAAGTITVAPGIVVQTCTGQPDETTCAPAYPGPGTFVETGSNFVNGAIVFAFEDSNPGAGAATFAGATINWGDASAPSAATVTFLGTGPCVVYPLNGVTPCSKFTVSGTHIYSFLGVYNVTSSIGLQVTFNVATVAASLVNEQISPPSSQVKAGNSVDLLVTLSPTTAGGYPQPVTLSCSSDPLVAAPLPAGMACLFQPSSSVPDVNQVRQIHVIVTTTGNTAMNTPPLLPGRNGPVQLALLLPAFFGTFGMLLLPGRPGRKRAFLWFGAALLVFVILLAGCGGGGTIGGGGGGGGNATPPGTYNVYVQANVAGLTSPVAVIQVIQ